MTPKPILSALSHPKTPGLLETMTIAEVREFHPEVVVIPIGSTEPHGPHLPYGTDTIIADGLTADAVRRANEAGARVLRLPPLPISNNVNFKEFPFACRVSVKTLMSVLTDLVDFVVEQGVKKIVLANHHGGNVATVDATLRQLYDRYQQKAFVCAAGAGSFAGSAYGELFQDHSQHAGDYETSMVSWFAPHLVVEEARYTFKPAVAETEALAGPQVHWVRPWHLYMEPSFAGSPERATAEKGRTFFEACAAGYSDFLVQLSAAPWHANFPYPPEAKS